MKQRISALDLQILAEELRNDIEGYRLTNIYNIADSNRQFLLRFNKPDSKFNLVVDCGLRIHITKFDRPIPPAPSGFVVKLRKHLKAKRLTALRRVENDRILVFQFADGLFYLVLEFFSAGNVILLDENRKILSLQRIVHEHENKVGQTYTMFDSSLFQKEVPATSESESNSYGIHLIKEWLHDAKSSESMKVGSGIAAAGKGKSKQFSIHRLLLTKESHLSSDLLSNNLKMHGIKPSTSCLEFIGKEAVVSNLLDATEKDFRSLLSRDNKSGFILAKKNAHFKPENSSTDLQYVYETFHPFKPFVGDEDPDSIQIIEVEGNYNNTLDKFFSTIESSKYALRIQQQEHLAQKKLQDARMENERKIQALVDVQSTNEQKGNTIINNANLVEEAKLAVQGLVDQQMDWSIIEKLIKSEQMKSNKIAQLIKLPLHLKENQIDLVLPIDEGHDEDLGDTNSERSSASHQDSNFSGDSEAEESDSSENSLSDFETEESTEDRRPQLSAPKTTKTIKVTIDLGLSAYANASQYFNAKKSSAEKQKKVEQNVKKAMKNIEEKVDKQLKKKLKESHNILRKVRSPYFFEKYFWFISSEGFLVLMGRSPTETDQIFSKYIEDDDIYITNNFGGNQVWIKNPARTEVPPNTLMQAGIFCMSASEAWSKKVSSSPTWCFAKNLTKFSDVDNTVLPPGNFHIKKENLLNMMPSVQLVMGFGFLWKIKRKGQENDDEEFLAELDEDLADESIGHCHQDEKDVLNEQVNSMSNELDPVQESELPPISKHTSGHSSRPVSVADTESEQESFEEITKRVDGDADSSREVPIDNEPNNIAADIITQMKKNVRGKKGKLKKMQSKYADQDDEERRLRLEALGTLKGFEKQEAKKQEELARQQNREFRKAKREKQKEQQALKFTKNEKVKIDYSKFAAELKPRLGEEDEAIDLIPVYAPWAALLKYKYKVKIQPGNAKKTKTLSEILNYFGNREVDSAMGDKDLDWPNEHDLIKVMKPQDLVLTICSDKLKVTLPGRTNKANQKPKGKQKKKN